VEGVTGALQEVEIPENQIRSQGFSGY
jgi:hypothetical protein